ncbi:MAG: glutathione ABC transporter permease GsiC, partial [Gammaproteobacteria bacterium]
MSRYLLKRCLGAVAVMWAVATLVFFMLRAVPGDPLTAMLFDTGDLAAVEELRERYGLDQPTYVQYFKWFANVMRGDFCASIYGSRVPV